MAYRTFVDSTGTEWQVWDVRPQARPHERRAEDDRRMVAMPIDHSDRRASPDRRAALVAPGMEGGWLCFQSGQDKRRLVPIPSAWDTESNDRLETYLRLAMMVEARTRR